MELNPGNASSSDVQLQSFLGMINFMQAFVSHISHHTTLLRDLLKKNVLAWDEALNQAFQWLKALMA